MIRVSLALNGCENNGFVACIEDDDGLSITLIDEPSEATVASACAEAAKKLRDAATRFDILATATDPVKSKTQDRINRASVFA